MPRILLEPYVFSLFFSISNIWKGAEIPSDPDETPKSQVNRIKTKNTRLNKANDKNKKRSTNDEMSKPKKSSHRNILEYVFHLSLLLGYNYIININYAITEYKIETFKERMDESSNEVPNVVCSGKQGDFKKVVNTLGCFCFT